MPSIRTAIVAALVAAPVAMGHSWIEQLRNVDDKGAYVGEYGYPRGMVSKTDPGFNGDSMNWQLPGANGKGQVFIDETSPMCHTNQRKQEQSKDNYPRLQATPGGFIAMRYMENGHVTLPNNQKGKPEKGGTIFVYGTTEPKEDETLVTVLRWSKDGQGGDKRGQLLAMNNFDDGRCYEKNPTPIAEERAKADPNYAMGQAVEGEPGNYPLFCETNIQLPETAEVGKPYTFYWVWQWNTEKGGADPGLPDGKDEYYTTCIDVDVASADVAMAADAEEKYALGPQQDAMSVAVSDYSSRTAIITDVTQQDVGGILSGKPTGSPSATGGAPAPTGGAPSPIAGAPSLSGTAPFLNSTAPTPREIPTLTSRPGAAPTSLLGGEGLVTVTDTVFVTVTGPAATQSPPAGVTPRAVHMMRHKNGAKFRGMFTS